MKLWVCQMVEQYGTLSLDRTPRTWNFKEITSASKPGGFWESRIVCAFPNYNTEIHRGYFIRRFCESSNLVVWSISPMMWNIQFIFSIFNIYIYIQRAGPAGGGSRGGLLLWFYAVVAQQQALSSRKPGCTRGKENSTWQNSLDDRVFQVFQVFQVLMYINVLYTNVFDTFA